MLFGAPGIAITMGLIVGAAVPLANWSRVDARPPRRGRTVAEVGAIPLIWGTAAGFPSTSPVSPPPPLQAFSPPRRRVDRPRPDHRRRRPAPGRNAGVRGVSLWLLAVKLLALPLIAAVVGRLLGLQGPELSGRRAVCCAADGLRRPISWRPAWAVTGAASPG